MLWHVTCNPDEEVLITFIQGSAPSLA